MTGMQQKRRMRKSNDEKKYVENIAGEREEKEHEKRLGQIKIIFQPIFYETRRLP